MVEMIKKLTDTQIVVGQNGLVWIKGDNEDLAVEAVMTIEEKSHVKGLTEYIKSILENKTGRKLEDERKETPHEKGILEQIEDDVEEFVA